MLLLVLHCGNICDSVLRTSYRSICDLVLLGKVLWFYMIIYLSVIYLLVQLHYLFVVIGYNWYDKNIDLFVKLYLKIFENIVRTYITQHLINIQKYYIHNIKF